MSFELPEEINVYLKSLDDFIARHIKPLQDSNDNQRFFDHRREHSRTNWSNQGLPNGEWENLMKEAQQLADQAGFYRFAYPVKYGGVGHPKQNLYMCAIRQHLSAHHGGGLSLANDLQSEHSMVANDPIIIMLSEYGTEEQQSILIPAALRGEFKATFGLTEDNHGSDATYLETTARPNISPNGEGSLAA
jgi:alkylation response protein AidB-like acyl-CoA dehydrogenase